jgi:hypothetical protein
MVCATVVALALIRSNHGTDVDAVAEDVDLLAAASAKREEAAARSMDALRGMAKEQQDELDALKAIVQSNALQLERVTREKTNSAIAKVLPVGAKS